MHGLELFAAAAVAFNMGTPAYTWQNGAFTGTITDTGVGDINLNLQADKALDATECVVILSMRGALNVGAGSQGTSFGCNHTSDVAKQITILREGAGGAASALADIDFDVLMFKRVVH